MNAMCWLEGQEFFAFWDMLKGFTDATDTLKPAHNIHWRLPDEGWILAYWMNAGMNSIVIALALFGDWVSYFL